MLSAFSEVKFDQTMTAEANRWKTHRTLGPELDLSYSKHMVYDGIAKITNDIARD